MSQFPIDNTTIERLAEAIADAIRRGQSIGQPETPAQSNAGQDTDALMIRIINKLEDIDETLNQIGSVLSQQGD